MKLGQFKMTGSFTYVAIFHSINDNCPEGYRTADYLDRNSLYNGVSFDFSWKTFSKYFPDVSLTRHNRPNFIISYRNFCFFFAFLVLVFHLKCFGVSKRISLTRMSTQMKSSSIKNIRRTYWCITTFKSTKIRNVLQINGKCTRLWEQRDMTNVSIMYGKVAPNTYLVFNIILFEGPFSVFKKIEGASGVTKSKTLDIPTSSSKSSFPSQCTLQVVFSPASHFCHTSKLIKLWHVTCNMQDLISVVRILLW